MTEQALEAGWAGNVRLPPQKPKSSITILLLQK
jgi:hypothetical protein